MHDRTGDVCDRTVRAFPSLNRFEQRRVGQSIKQSMLGDGVVGSFHNSHGQYRSEGLAQQERPCCRVETARHSLAVYVES